MSFEFFEHTADTGLEVRAPSLAELFRQAALGMFAVTHDVEDGTADAEMSVTATADDVGELLVNWLAELLADSEIHHLAFVDIAIDHCDEGAVRGTAFGVSAADVTLHGPPIKAVTYHDLLVERDGDGWKARIIFDV